MENDVSNEFNRIARSDLKELSSAEPLIVNNVVRIFKKKSEKTGTCCTPRCVSNLSDKFLKLCKNQNDGDFIAVNHLSFGVQKKECFGLLGLNGAGKT